jgi:hypothetical protein
LKRIRARLTYANVISTLALFLVLGGGAAIAATELEPNSVATVHIQPQAVTGVKIKSGAVISSRLADEAVTEGKISDGAVTADKIANGSVTAAKLDPGLGSSRVVERIRGTAAAQFPRLEDPRLPVVPYPLDNPTFTQPAGENHQYIGSFEVRFLESCMGRRSATAQLRINPTQRLGDFPEIIAEGTVEDEGPGERTIVGQFFLLSGKGQAAAPAAATQRTFSVALLSAHCGRGGTGAVMTGAQVDVIGIR